MSLRKMLFWIHLAVGCAAGAVILIMSVTGVLLMYERQITAWFDRDFRAAPPWAGAVRLPVETMLANICSQKASMPSAITLRAALDAPAEVSFGREHVFFVDTYTGRVLGEGSRGTRSFFRTVEDWHRWLGAGSEHRAAARAVTGACNFAFLFLVVSGPYLWIPRKWSWQSVKAVTAFRGGLSGRARDFNWHNVMGIWCALPLFLIVLSGVLMSYPWATNLLYRVTGNEPPAQGARQRPAAESRQTERHRRDGSTGPSLTGFNRLWTRAEQQVPGWKSVTLRFTPSNDGTMAFTIDKGDGGRPDQRSQLTLDSRTAELVRWEPFARYNAGRRLRSWFRFLHTGEAGGVAGQTIAGIASAGAAMLVWTGIWLAFRRLRAYRKRAKGQTPSLLRDKDYAMSAKC
jgi:uncharacterized iron-regulated membrane protein